MGTLIMADAFTDLNMPTGKNWVMDGVYGLAWPQILAFSSAVLGLFVVGLVVRALRGG